MMSTKPTWPYSGASSWGLTMSYAKSGNFWRFFTICPGHGGNLSAKCSDGKLCPADTAPPLGSSPLPSDWTHAKFMEGVQAITNITGTKDCLENNNVHAYNEF